MIFTCWRKFKTLRYVKTYVMIIEYIEGIELV
ncbi:lipopolysaccharide core biosynthesis protein [Salmonella enterica subsp. enterica]|uniref:Lipopolysaccharide core biosynthesis protein n=1 Tax=Salmonella enterica I TaxID=59201 RepID=A0A447TSG0_SALET|nr:lipopolysaccharide core biosynthesis protein [Salmonella enterica subsp. enterica]